MIPFYLIILSSLLLIIDASPVSYQYVKFVRNGNRRGVTAASATRRSRSFGFSNSKIFSSSSIWNDDDDDDFLNPHLNSLGFETNRGHITPDFSDGLGYPDPFLLTGPAAKRAVSLLYRKPLFFGEINHVDSLLRNQEMRRRNGLGGNRLGSLRPYLPFYRFREQRQRYFK